MIIGYVNIQNMHSENNSVGKNHSQLCICPSAQTIKYREQPFDPWVGVSKSQKNFRIMRSIV
jgi:hypothetical protein